jgi:hypothetical protein
MARIKTWSTGRAVLAATTAGLAFTAAAAHAQPVPGGQPIPRSQIAGRDPTVTPTNQSYFHPRIGVQALVTDNVYLTPTDHTSDVLTSISAGLQAAYGGPRLDAMVDLQGGYDSYSRAHQLNGFSVTGMGTAAYQIVDQFLSFEADGNISNGNATTFGSPAVTRSGTAGQTQVLDASAGPRMRTVIGDVLDVDARARVGWVGYKEADGSVTTDLPQDTTLGTIDILTTTGKRYASHEISTLLRYAVDDNNFSLYSGVASAYVNVSDSLRLIGRGGYDEVRQGAQANLGPRVDIKSPMWSLGFEYELNPTATFRFEGGHRYDDASFASEILVEMTDRIYVLSRYEERILPAQIAFNDDFLTFVQDTRSLPGPLRAESFTFQGGLENETSKEKIGDVRMTYSWPTQSVSLGATWLGRERLQSKTHEENVSVDVGYERQMRPDLRGNIELQYGRTLDEVGTGNSRYFRGSAQLRFQYTSSIEIIGGYGYSNDRQTGVGGTRLVENAAYVSIAKSF